MNVLNMSFVALMGLGLTYAVIKGGEIQETERMQVAQEMKLTPTADRLMRVCDFTVSSKRLVAKYGAGHELNICACAGKNIAKDIDSAQAPIVEKMLPILFTRLKANDNDPAIRDKFNGDLTHIMTVHNLTVAETKRLYKVTIDSVNMCSMPSNIDEMGPIRDRRNKLRTPEEQAEHDAVIADYKKRLDARRQKLSQSQ